MNQTRDMQNVVIVGGSHAAAEAISTLRRAGWQDNITLIGDETVLPYQRPPLSKAYYQGEVSLAKLAIKNAEFYEKAGVDLQLGKRVTELNRESQSLSLNDKTTVKYSKLILATGTRARELPIEGAELPQVKTLRTVADVDSIKQDLKPGGSLLIIGAGYIGLEVAASALKQDIKVTVLEAADRVLARVTSPEVSSFFETIHRDAGVDLRVNSGVSKFTANGDSVLATLPDGEQLEADCAIVGIGVVPNVELAERAGLACDNGIIVDEYTRTTDANIFAVGDCSNHPSPLYGRRVRLESVPNATAQAKTAALAICGKEQIYDQLPWFWSDQFDVKLQTAGLLQDYDEAVVDGDIDARKFTVSYFKAGQFIAMDAINSPAEFMRAKKRIAQELAD